MTVHMSINSTNGSNPLAYILLASSSVSLPVVLHLITIILPNHRYRFQSLSCIHCYLSSTRVVLLSTDYTQTESAGKRERYWISLVFPGILNSYKFSSQFIYFIPLPHQSQSSSSTFLAPLKIVGFANTLIKKKLPLVVTLATEHAT